MHSFEVNIGREISPRYGAGVLNHEYIDDIVQGRLAEFATEQFITGQGTLELPKVSVRGDASDTEATYIIKLEGKDVRRFLRVFNADLAKALMQDCIAVRCQYTGYASGTLVGEYRHLWGEYNPKYFIRF